MKKLLLVVIVPLLALGLSSCGTPMFDFDGDGAPDDLDCAPTDPEVRWGLDEVLDGKDNDCDGDIDEGTVVFDDDGDGYCEGLWDEDIGGWVRRHDGPDDDRNCGAGEEDPGDLRVDCDDGDADLSPGDVDGDGWDTCGGPDGDALLDCDDSNPAVYPGATELCDGLDTNCDGNLPSVEENEDLIGGLDCSDDDGDGYTEVGEDELLGTPDDDCDDENENTYPGAPEVCDGLLNDCGADAKLVPDHGLNDLDEDGDGHFACGGGVVVDCDDNSAKSYPEAPEICDGKDNDCVDGANFTDEDGYGEGDQDEDTMLPCGGDCDDLDSQISPAAFEIAGNEIDEDCDGDFEDADAVWCDAVFSSSNAPSLTDKIELATDGDTICVEPGEWEEFIDFGDAAVQLVGMGGPLVTSVVPVEGGGESSSLVTFVGPSAVAEYRPALRGFTLSGNTKVKTDNPNSEGDEESTEGQGGAVYIRGAAPVLDRLWIHANVADAGGGVYIEGPRDIEGFPAAQGTTIRRSFISGNSASCDSFGCDGGGGIFARGGVILEVEASYIASNHSATEGGGIALAGASVALSQVKLHGNAAGAQGGGLYGAPEGDSQVVVVMNYVQLAGNVAGGQGGGMHLRGRQSERARLDMEYVSILRNVSQSEGGGVSLQQAELAANHTAWVANVSSGTGAALRCAVTTHCDLEATDVSFNTNFIPGGAALFLGGSVGGMTSVNVYENSLDFHCEASGTCDEFSSLGNVLELSPGYLAQAGIEAGVNSVLTSGDSTAFFDAPWTWDMHLDPDAEPSPGLQDVLSAPDLDPDFSAGDLGIYGGLDADQWDLDGDGAPQAWRPGGYAAAEAAGEAAGLDCNDTSPFVWNGSPWFACPAPSGPGG